VHIPHPIAGDLGDPARGIVEILCALDEGHMQGGAARNRLHYILAWPDAKDLSEDRIGNRCQLDGGVLDRKGRRGQGGRGELALEDVRAAGVAVTLLVIFTSIADQATGPAGLCPPDPFA
jgi:hypothetical protein